MVGCQPAKMSQRQGAGSQELDTTYKLHYALQCVWGLTADLSFADALIYWPISSDVEKLHAWRHQKHLGDLWSEHKVFCKSVGFLYLDLSSGFKIPS